MAIKTSVFILKRRLGSQTGGRGRGFTSCSGGGLLFIIVCLLLSLAGAGQASEKKGRDSHLQKRPYAPESPWNLQIGPDPDYDPLGDIYIEELHGVFGANPNMYAYPVYEVTPGTVRQEAHISNWYSNVVEDGTRLIKERDVVVEVPIPPGAGPARGRDSHLVVWDVKTGDEWGFWQIRRTPKGWTANNGYHYNTNWNAVPPRGFVSRGAGIPYLAGLVRPWELARGRIEHAIALAVNHPSRFHIYPATKSDGEGLPPLLPEGARLQLDPELSAEDFDAWGLSREARVIARALQEYGMILTDGSGHPKISVEYQATAGWGALLDKDIVRNIPYSAFRLLSLEAPKRPVSPQNCRLSLSKGRVLLSWDPSPSATRYRVKRRAQGEDAYRLLAGWLTANRFADQEVILGRTYEYVIVAVNHNGLSRPSEMVSVRVDK